MAGNKKDIRYWVGFNAIPGVGRVRFNQLESYFDSLEDAWEAGPDELRRAGLDRNAIRAIVEWRPKILLDEVMKKLEQYKMRAVT